MEDWKVSKELAQDMNVWEICLTHAAWKAIVKSNIMMEVLLFDGGNN